MQSGGASLIEGARLFLGDLAKGRISMSDDQAFEVGRNLATTPGSVVFENELMQLIQYAPVTAKVHKRPLVIVPPCINKFYILDLQPENSLVAHAVAAGHTVFLVSWRNVGKAQGHLTWDDYVERGVLQALSVARRIRRSDKVDTLGFCIGGTLARRCAKHRRQLVAGMDRLAGRARWRARRRTAPGRQRRFPRHRAGARPLRQGAGRVSLRRPIPFNPRRFA
jgi:poly(3-hydroxyalkanoate) synthetase